MSNVVKEFSKFQVKEGARVADSLHDPGNNGCILSVYASLSKHCLHKTSRRSVLFFLSLLVSGSNPQLTSWLVGFCWTWPTPWLSFSSRHAAI